MKIDPGWMSGSYPGAVAIQGRRELANKGKSALVLQERAESLQEPLMPFEAARNPGAHCVIRLASGMSCTMLENVMKTLTLIPIAALAMCTTLAYAGDAAGTSSTATDSNAAMTSDAVGGTSVGSSGSGTFHGKTRAEVNQELQRAQKDGTLDRLNALYGGQ